MEKNQKSSIELFQKKFPAINNQVLKEVMAENFDGITVDAFTLSKIKIPAGGSIVFDEPIEAKEFEGIILASQNIRAYWDKPFDEGGAMPPVCSSFDAVFGKGDPGGVCARCNMAQFGSADNLRGQACRHIVRLFIMREGRFLPEVLPLPPTSIKVYRAYITELSGKLGVFKYGLLTKFSLEKATSAGNIVYSKIKMAPGNEIDPELIPTIKEYSEGVKKTFITTVIDEIQDEFYLEEDEK